MQLIYCYIKKFRNIMNQEIYFSDHYKITYDGDLRIIATETDQAEEIIYKGSVLKYLHLLVGKTGAGKTNVLQMIGMPENIRFHENLTGDSYFLLYKETKDFVIEIFNISLSSFPCKREDMDQVLSDIPEEFRHHVRLRRSMKMFRFACDKSGVPINVKMIRFQDTDQTFIFNGFDQNAFTSCPYEDRRTEGADTNTGWLARYASPYHRAALFYSCRYLKEYIDSFAQGNIKRNAALKIRRDNWADAIKIHLGDKLMKSDYWLFADQIREDVERKILKKPVPKRKKVSIKNQFIHDLWTDFAIYLRKWIAYIDSWDMDESPSVSFDEMDVFQEYLDYTNEKEGNSQFDASIVPDFEKMSIVKRLERLAQYIDRKGDGRTHGLVWQIFGDIRDIGNILNKFDDKYFTNDEFTLPLEEIYRQKNRDLVNDLFDCMMQYRPDDVGIFTKELLPYHFSYISSGEWQYAKILGAMEENCVRLSMNGKRPNLIYLLDEPETYMHPELCRKFLSYTDQLLRQRDSGAQIQLIISTHSPFLLSDVLPGQVTRFDVDEKGYCVVKNYSEKKYFGANIHTILADGFFLEYTIGEYSRVFLQDTYDWLKKLVERGQLNETERRKVEEISRITPQIGEELIRRSFENIVRNLL